MNKQILADYYEERGFIGKAKRLRNRKPIISTWRTLYTNFGVHAHFLYYMLDEDYMGFTGNNYIYYRYIDGCKPLFIT